MGYCRHVCEDGPRKQFESLDRGNHFNSHFPVLEAYRRMLAVWKPLKGRMSPDTLTKEEIFSIVSERPHPESPLGSFIRAKPEGSVQ